MSSLPYFLKIIDTRHRLLFSIVLAVLVSILLPSWLHYHTRILCIWNTGVVSFLGTTLGMMVLSTPEKMRRNAQRQYAGRLAILTLIIAAAFASVLAIGFLLNDNKKEIPIFLLTVHVTLSVITIVSAWLLVHTTFALQYARSYYQKANNSQEISKGLDFPDDNTPDYWDFMYFSFGIGMTSQVSDVQTTSRTLRRLVLLHSVLSFFFNTAILAMSINIIAGLI